MAVKNISLNIEIKTITAIIGPSGCGKSTLLRSLNRMNDLILSSRTGGEFFFQGVNHLQKDTDVIELRRRVPEWSFKNADPFQNSVYENVAHSPRAAGEKDRLDEIVESGGKGCGKR